MKRLAILYSGSRIVLLLVAASIIALVISYYYYSWNPPGIQSLLGDLQMLGYKTESMTPKSLLAIVEKIAPQITDKAKRILVLAPYDSIESGFAMFTAPPSIMLHGLVILLVTLYGSALNEITRTGIYGVVSAAQGSRTKLLYELLRSHAALSLLITLIALSPLVFIGAINPWTGWRGIMPLLLIYFTSVAAVLAEILLYTMITIVMIQQRLFYESILATVIMIYIVPALLLASASLFSGNERVVRLIFTLLVALIPLHSGPGLLYEAIKHGADGTAAHYLSAGPEPLLASMGFTLSVIASLALMLYARKFLEENGVPW